jgi:hypothetical protein
MKSQGDVHFGINLLYLFKEYVVIKALFSLALNLGPTAKMPISENNHGQVLDLTPTDVAT